MGVNNCNGHVDQVDAIRTKLNLHFTNEQIYFHISNTTNCIDRIKEAGT